MTADSRLRLKPGRHEIRVAAEDSARDLRGSVYTYVDVPDFAKAPLSLSGVVLGTTSATPQKILGDLLPITPTAQREFGRSRRIAAFVRVYHTTAEQQTAAVTATVLDIQSAVVFRRTTHLRARESEPQSADYLLQLPLSTLPSGDYLTIEATRGEHIVSRDIRFGVR